MGMKNLGFFVPHIISDLEPKANHAKAPTLPVHQGSHHSHPARRAGLAMCGRTTCLRLRSASQPPPAVRVGRVSLK